MKSPSNFLKDLLRLSFSFTVKKISPSIDILQNLLGLTILVRKYKLIGTSKRFPSRESLWDFILEKNKDNIIYLEFGVHKGYSIKYFANKNKNPNSKFFGFDSFFGLPENWRNFAKIYKANHFNVKGNVPSTNDARISFIKGWFNETLPDFISKNKEFFNHNVIIHMDADLYSSTLYCLTKLDSILEKYTVIFDELPGEEARALYDYQKSYCANVEYLGYCGPGKLFPMNVALRISTNKV